MPIYSVSSLPAFGSHISSGSGKSPHLKGRRRKNLVGPINTEQISVWSLAYKRSGAKIVSGRWNKPICIQSTKTGKLVIGTIKDVHITK
ncbi:hypothetical protein BDR03DRAFT_971402 [Suillus americanus]|nr:hypothetical protein BDR03DRAFT_971402 [Suillus americanus]